MATHQHATLEDTVYFWFGANDTSGSGDDGASPLYDVRLAGAAADAIPVLSGSPTLLTHANYSAGAHEVAVAATNANGFAATNTYAVFVTLLVDSQNPTGFAGSFTLDPIIANVKEVSDDTTAANNLELFTEVLENGTGLIDAGTFKAGAIDSSAIADAAIDNATFAADVGSTAYATNIIALACRKVLDEIKLDTLAGVDTTVAADGDLEDYVVAGSVLAHLMSANKDVTAFKCTTDSLEAIKVHADTIKAETASIQVETTALDTLTKAAGDGDLAAVLLSLPGVAPNAAGGLIISTDGGLDADRIIELLEGDEKLDYGQTPARRIIYLKGTDTEILKKQLLKVGGGNVTAVTETIGESENEAV